MRHNRLPALLLALLLILAGCRPVGEGPSQATPELEPTPSASAEPSPWTEDWELFWMTLDENYPFGDVMRRTTGRTLADIEAEYRPAAEQVQSAEELLAVLLDVSEKFGLTGHLWAHEAAWYNHWCDLFCGTEEEYGAFSSYFGPRLDNEKSRALYGRTEKTDAARSETAAEPKEPNLTFAYYPEQKAAYVEVREMNPDSGDWEAEEQKLVDFYRSIEAEGYKHCIIDIRRNPGGSSYYTQILAGPLLTGSYGQDHYYLINGGDEVWDYFDAVGIQRAAVRTIDYLPQEKLPALEPGDLEWATHFMKVFDTCGAKFQHPAFTGRVWLLVGPNNYSASEYCAIVCKESGAATLVGQRTGGDGLGMSPLCCVLPNSGIVYQFSTLNGLNLDGGSNEEFGTAPDIEVPEGEDALEVCLRAIEEAGS